MIYTIDGIGQNVAWDNQGEALSQAFDIDGLPLLGDHKPIKNYDYENDPDPDKGIVWDYNLNELRRIQGNCFTIGIMTDTHYITDTCAQYYSGWSVHPDPQGASFVTQLKNMTKRLYFDCIAHFGDIGNGWELENPTEDLAETAEVARRLSDYVESPLFIARGNHDVGMYMHRQGAAKTMSEVIPKADLYNTIIGTVKDTTTIVEGTSTDFYYYKDFDECRVIVLDTNDYPYQQVSDYDVHGNHHTMSAAQLNWLVNTALDTNKPVLVLCHNTIIGDVMPPSNPLPTPVEDKQYDRMATYRGNDAVTALENFVNGGGTVVAVLIGHAHTQQAAKVNGINHIMFPDYGYAAEICFVDFDENTITTKVVGTLKNHYGVTQNWTDRTFTF